MRIIWATRGHDWGFRFLRDAGYADPLPAYEAAFASAGTEPTTFARSGDALAVRFPDPLGRKDSAGRVIPHEFVIYPPLADEIDSPEEARETIWPLVAEEFANAWSTHRASGRA